LSETIFQLEIKKTGKNRANNLAKLILNPGLWQNPCFIEQLFAPSGELKE